jgi:aminoglycoside phosphotransferase (APT) family kinase protein
MKCQDRGVLICNCERTMALDGAEIAALARVEVALLERLSSTSPVGVPQPVATCSVHGSMRYRRIPGTAFDDTTVQGVSPEWLAEQLCGALGALHRLDVDEARRLGVTDLSGDAWRDAFVGHCARCRRRVGPQLPVAERDEARRFLASFAEGLPQLRGDEVVVHCDLGPAHLLCDDDGLTGIIDWTDACIGDRAIDLAWVLNGAPEPLRHEVAERLAVDDDVALRARRYHQFAPWFEVEYGLDQGRDDLVRRGVRGVTERLRLDGAT